MKWHLKLFCKWVSKLDRIPRYGRIYKLSRTEDGWELGPPRWGWHRRGYWGLYLLDRRGLLWPYLDEMMGPYDTEKEN